MAITPVRPPLPGFDAADDGKALTVQADGTLDWEAPGGGHDPVTVADTASIDLTLTGQAISAAATFGTTSGTVAEGDHDHDADYQPLDADLTAVAGLASTGLVARTGAGTAAVRTITGGSGITVNNGSGASANPEVVRDGISLTTALNFVIDGGGSAIATGVKGWVRVPFAWTDIAKATILADAASDAVVDVWKDSFANFPPTDADSITASAPLTLSTDDEAEDATLTGWTTTGSAGDILAFNVDSNDNATLLTVVLDLVRSV